MQYSDGARNGDVGVNLWYKLHELKLIEVSLVRIRWSADAGKELPDIVKH